MDLCVAMHADQDQMLQIWENYCRACFLHFKNYGFCMYRCRFSRLSLFFLECTGQLIHADTDRRLHHSINKTGFPLISRNSPMRSDVAVFYACGVLASFAQSKIMVYVTQEHSNLRNDMFIHMEGLLIRYFDTHPHGDIMSTYTNDIDTPRQMISQSIPRF